MNALRSLPAELYTKDYYLETCGGFEEFLAGAVAPRLLKALEYGAIREGMRVLDMGCGRGELAVKCAEAGCHVWGIDYSADAIAKDYLRKSTNSTDGKQIVFQRMDAKVLAFPTDFFDRVFMIDIVEHLYPEVLVQCLREVRRVIRPGGRIVVHTAPNAWLIKPVYLVAGLVFGWRRHRYHVNEQSHFSLRRHLSPLGGMARVYISKMPGFFQLGAGPRISPSSLAGRIAGLADAILDGSLATALICHSPLKLILGTDLWATVDIPEDAEPWRESA
ncbi:MAG: class I SAM-dependent methyltransferase [Chloroflexi bacterium]|nr:class I SAM-dependent methyltransferase [Chloroflexota bacterium]